MCWPGSWPAALRAAPGPDAEGSTASAGTRCSPPSAPAPSGTGSPFPSRGRGLHFLLKLDTAEGDEALRERAAALGVRLGFLSEYAALPSPAYDHTLVVNYAGLNPAALPDAMEALAEVFRL